MLRKAALRLSILLCVVGMAACAITPDSDQGKNLHASLWQEQEAQRNEILTQQVPASGRLLVLAAGLSDETKAFRGDVQGTIDLVRTVRPDALIWHMWNAPAGQKVEAPFAHRDSLQQAVAQIRAAARPGDRILVMLTSHGNVNLLANVIAGRSLASIQGQELRQILQPLTDWDTGIVISACYSGSLIPALRHPRRWIMTAAAADRNSYGCQFQAQQTYFIQSLLSSFVDTKVGLESWHQTAAERIRLDEERAKLKPSLPQLWVGPAVQRYRQSLNGFWSPST